MPWPGSVPTPPSEWRWQYVFCASRLSVDPGSGKAHCHNIHESALQRVIKRAADELGICKRVACHMLRHSLARERLQHPHCAEAIGPFQRRHHHDLYPCALPRWGGGAQPGGFSLIRGHGFFHPTQTRAFLNRRSQGPSEPHSSGYQEFCRLRITRSGWGIMMVTRPSSLVRPAIPCGDPLGLAG